MAAIVHKRYSINTKGLILKYVHRELSLLLPSGGWTPRVRRPAGDRAAGNRKRGRAGKEAARWLEGGGGDHRERVCFLCLLSVRFFLMRSKWGEERRPANDDQAGKSRCWATSGGRSCRTSGASDTPQSAEGKVPSATAREEGFKAVPRSDGGIVGWGLRLWPPYPMWGRAGDPGRGLFWELVWPRNVVPRWARGGCGYYLSRRCPGSNEPRHPGLKYSILWLPNVFSCTSRKGGGVVVVVGNGHFFCRVRII